MRLVPQRRLGYSWDFFAEMVNIGNSFTSPDTPLCAGKERRSMAKKRRTRSSKLATPRLSKTLMAKVKRLLKKKDEEAPDREFKPMEFADLQKNVVAAVKRLLEEDHLLFAINVNERTIMHRFARLLEDAFDGYDIDCEYNRKGFNDTKWVEDYPKKASTRDTKGTTAFPDIIIHHRTVDLANLLVIELKKSCNPEKDSTDKDKLEELVEGSQYEYRVGMFIEITTGFDILKEDAIVARGYWLGTDVPEPGTMTELHRHPYTLPQPILRQLYHNNLDKDPT
jgi:hypothetical protein